MAAAMAAWKGARSEAEHTVRIAEAAKAAEVTCRKEAYLPSPHALGIPTEFIASFS